MRIRFLVLLVLASLAAASVAQAEMTAPSATSPTVKLRSSQFGPILFDGGNRVLYAFTHDPRGRTTCYGACASSWPPFTVRGALRAGPGTKRALLGTTRRRDGSRQLTYARKPLYYYVHDPRGHVLCQNVREFGGLWLVVRPNGKLVR